MPSLTAGNMISMVINADVQAKPLKLIDREQYPELDLIMWDLAGRFVTPERALHLYETRWRFLDQQRLTPPEKVLIERLAQAYGHGVMLTA